MYWINITLGILIPLVLIAAVVLPWVIGFAMESIGAFIASAALLWFGVWGLIAVDRGNLASTQATETIRINKTENIATGKSSKYLIYTDKGVYQDSDEWYYLKFNSSDVYNQIQPNKNYQCVVVGWRVQFFSEYRNVISCTDA